ncbi:MerR family transcriptional regulator [Gordonia soli]|uniref:Putative MerR family transcriptional regulator n=1 Tax=Gordonia soli NBRC 108243 TaxID=1223545 RepID=M0QR71_9ACTN|nr:MerR family transcriptional regulator [Gordonia soli]GAC70889.1 putative MerR family transcriptional regulator [Gordonia soli NBRC 108243]
MRTTQVAIASGYSVQQIRDLERIGVVSPASRSPNGYRDFTPAHVEELAVYREFTIAVGPVAARHALREIRTLPVGSAITLVARLHAGLQRDRERTLTARAAVSLIVDEDTDTDPDPTDPDPTATDSMTITELAAGLDVRASTLRFWESEGLVRPDRIPGAAGSTRRYATTAIREARITAALRAAGHGIPTTRAAITALRDMQGADASLGALDGRLAELDNRALALLRASAGLAAIIAGRNAAPERDRSPAAAPSNLP